jgi:predicted ArsR family transcriptional regulator
VSDHSADHSSPRLELLKALGDNTRYAIYLELARSPRPLATAEVAETLGLHPNTVRPHLERMREVGLLEVGVEARGTVGRPQHRYSLAEGAPSLGFEPPAFPVLARMLLRLAVQTGVPAEDAIDAGRDQATQVVTDADPVLPVAEALHAAMDRLGFDPATVVDGDTVTIAFTRCPFRELAQTAPEVVCNLHRGLVEGFVGQHGPVPGEPERVVADFCGLAARTPCQVELAPAAG